MNRLKEKVAIVYGAGPNVGGTIALFLAREAARVLVVDIDEGAGVQTRDFIRAKGWVCESIVGNASVESDVVRATDRATELFGGVHIVVNMGGAPHWSSVLDMEKEAWDRAVLSFPTAGMMTTKYGARRMIEGGHSGSIMHIASTAAHFGQAEASAFAASKAALVNFARSAAMDLGRYNIRVNTVTPCSMEHQLWTLMKNEASGGAFERVGGKPQYSRDDYLKNLPLGKFPGASDIAWACVYLASDEAGAVTGIDLPVDSGLRHKYPTWRPGDWTGANIADYMKTLRKIEYDEDKGPAIPEGSVD